MISNAQRWFTLAIAAVICIYAASATPPPSPRPGTGTQLDARPSGAAGQRNLE
jgi:hypothetical protein